MEVYFFPRQNRQYVPNSHILTNDFRHFYNVLRDVNISGRFWFLILLKPEAAQGSALECLLFNNLLILYVLLVLISASFVC
jgi:hypothetical protein